MENFLRVVWNPIIYVFVIEITDRLTLILLTLRIRWAPNNASKGQMGFNSAFKGLNSIRINVQVYQNNGQLQNCNKVNATQITRTHKGTQHKTRKIITFEKDSASKLIIKTVFLKTLVAWNSKIGCKMQWN